MAVSFGRRVAVATTNQLTLSRRYGYYVLLPETGHGEDVSNNPLLQSAATPKFSDITAENCVSAIGVQTMDYETKIKRLEETLASTETSTTDIFEDVLVPIEKIGAPLDATWGTIKTLHIANAKVVPRKAYMGIHERAKHVRSLKYTSEPIYSTFKKLSGCAKTEEQKRIVQKFLLEGRLNGLDLERSKKANLNNILFKLAKAKTAYRDKLEIATNQFKHVIKGSSIMTDFPEDVLKMMAADRSQPGRGPWTVTLQPAVATGFLEHCADRDQRWNVWQASVRRCSTHNEKSLENSTTVQEIRIQRRNLAKLLGYDKYADLSMETKMAGSVENVQKMLSHLLDKALPVQEEELLQLETFAAEQGFEGPMQIWDVPYWKTRQQKLEFGLDEDSIREYFPLPKVLSGLFMLCESLMGLQFVEESGVDKWNPDVQFYNIFEVGSTEPVGSFFIDPYIREDEKLQMDGASGWMIPMANKCTIIGRKPLAALVFNFRPPLYGKPSLLSFTEVNRLFKTFGHGLQHLLSKASYSEVSGLSNLEWDAAEISSNVLDNWLYQRSFLESLSGHYESGEPLPTPIVEQLVQLRNHMAGYDLCRELYLSALDIELHSSTEFWVDVIERMWPQYNVLPLDKKDSHPCSFSAIFSDEWAAAYYSHIWARLVAADVFSAFLEAGLENKEECQVVGKRFRSTYLALGGACHPGEVFRRFRGRDPSAKALLRSLGIKQPKLMQAVNG
ncbi:uncharacterized protein LOC126253269 [Schistocerca nitens]|uniref:uncharacterized protein LOC126253269 n=1 Tax=Schistocerca nitens TaxID=7011 RepID=UPI0021174BF9|nr:uncharacterized protein LOC126253269 [Schistocerca nitens]